MRNGPESLQFRSFVHDLCRLFSDVPDWRKPNLIDFPLLNIIMAGLAMMFWQDPGLLPFQRRMKEKKGSSNLESLFHVSQIPGDTQFRNLLDPIDPTWLKKGMRLCVTKLQKTRAWVNYHVFHGRVLVLLDGTDYFLSENIKCPSCLERHHRDGRVDYFHQALVASIAQPNSKQVLPIFAEEIRRGDGATKNDCESNSAKRLLPELAKNYCHLDIVIVADSLYSKSPIIELVRTSGMSYLFVAQKGDHPHLQEEIAGLRLAHGITSVELPGDKGGLHRYEFAHDIPLFSSTDAICNWVSYTEISSSGKVGYHNEWVTNLKPTKQNVCEIAIAGRQRSKIENETFNALKNHGFHFEHNFGHGKEHLQFNFLLLNLLAFLMHQLLALGDKLYREALSWKGAVYEFIDYIRWAIRMVIWPDWETLLNHFLERGPELRIDTG